MPEYISKRVAECEALMRTETDQVRKSALRLLRDMWLALANVADSMSEEELDREVAAVDSVHVSFLRGSRMH